MQVELIEDTPDTPWNTEREVHGHPTRHLRAAGVLACAAALLGAGYLAGTSSAPPAVTAAPSAAPAPPAAASSSLAASTLIETSTGLYVDVDQAVLGSPVTAGATTLREAAELWAADQTAALTEPERDLLREGDELTLTLDAATGKITTVTQGRLAAVDSHAGVRPLLPPWSR